jgi:rhodanese-related sulfurtransferase
MIRRIRILFLACMLVVFSVATAWSFEVITAAKAYEMAKSDEAILIDTRTIEECYWLGSPALTPGGMPIAYNLPWKLWPSNRIAAKEDYFEPSMILAEQGFGMILDSVLTDKTINLILICRSGHRTSAAAQYLEGLGFTNVYTIDNYLKVDADLASGAPKIGGQGGFQGSGSNSPSEYAGYRGWPGRVFYLPTYPDHDPNWLPTDSSQSVSWMDTGLPVTQKLDANKIVYFLLGWVYQ